MVWVHLMIVFPYKPSLLALNSKISFSGPYKGGFDIHLRTVQTQMGKLLMNLPIMIFTICLINFNFIQLIKL